MGGTQSTANKTVNEKISTLEPVDAIHLIAAKYILTQNFSDMNKLSSKEYCDKLVILTSDILKKFMTTKDIKYLSNKVENGIPINEIKKEKVVYLDIHDIEDKQKMEQSTVTDQKYVFDRNMGWKQLASKNITKKKMFQNMDVSDKINKERMCKGIAKFYVKIAHIFSAILKTVNPVFTYKDQYGNEHVYSIKNKDKIPTSAKPKLSETNLCTRRINSLRYENIGDKIKIFPPKICSINKKTTTVSVGENILPSRWGNVETKEKTLGDETGIPELEKLYYDNYDYTNGKFISMSKKSKKEYEKNLKTFYKYFTGDKKMPYSKWNKNKNKKFSDIPLTDFEELDLCDKKKEDWQPSYEGDTELFKKYATHLKKMMSTANKGQKELIGFLDKIFVWQKKGDQSDITIQPDLNETKLETLTSEIREKIINLYFNCEKDFKEAVNIFVAIISERNLKNTQLKTENMEQQLETVMGENIKG